MRREELEALMNGPHLRLSARAAEGAAGWKHRKGPVPRGHVMPPGSGPQGETCGSCGHLVRKRMSGTYLKCGLNRANWTGGGGSDVRARDAACSSWAKGATTEEEG